MAGSRKLRRGARPAGSSGAAEPGFVDLHGHTLVAGFIDVHVHGVEGFDTLDSLDAVEEIARRLVRFGVTAFCPTAVACSPAVLERLIESMGRARRLGPAARARARRPPREQLHQPGFPRRPAARLPAPAAALRAGWSGACRPWQRRDLFGRRRPAGDRGSPRRRRNRDDGRRARWRPRPGQVADCRRASRVARALRRDLRAGPGRHRRRRPARHASVQPDVAA